MMHNLGLALLTIGLLAYIADFIQCSARKRRSQSKYRLHGCPNEGYAPTNGGRFSRGYFSYETISFAEGAPRTMVRCTVCGGRWRLVEVININRKKTSLCVTTGHL